MIITGPINVEQIGNLVEHAAKVLAEIHKDDSRASINIKQMPLTYRDILSPSADDSSRLQYQLPSSYKNFLKLYSSEAALKKVLTNPEDLGLAVDIDCSWYWSSTFGWNGGIAHDNISRIKVIDLSTIEDILDGIAMPDPVRKIYVSQKTASNKNVHSEYRANLDAHVESVLGKLQSRLDRSVSKVGYDVVRDLHS